MVRDKDFNILKKDYFIVFKFYGNATYYWESNKADCSYTFRHAEVSMFSLSEQAYYDPFFIVNDLAKNSVNIYFRVFTDVDVEGGSLGVGLDSNLIGKAGIKKVQYDNT